MRIFSKFILISVLSLYVLTASAGDWPHYFDLLTKERYILVVLHENGKAEFLKRDTHFVNGTAWFLHDDTAAWGYYNRLPENGLRSSIWVGTEQFRFDYQLEENRLIEIDKMGMQNILTRVKNTKPEAK